MTADAMARTTQIRSRTCTLNHRTRVDARTLNEACHSLFSIDSLSTSGTQFTPIHHAASAAVDLGNG